MTGTQLATLIRKKTRTVTGTFSDADMLVDVNLAKDDIAAVIAEVRHDAFNVIDKQDLVKDQRKYAFSVEVMNSLVAVHIRFTTGATDDPVELKEIKLHHLTDISLDDESQITDNFTNVYPDPKYLVRRKNIFILSGAIVAVTNGLIITFKSFPDDLPNMTGTTELSTEISTTKPGFPREFHELLARAVSIEYKGGNRIRLNKKENEYEDDLQKKVDEYYPPSVEGQIFGSLPTGAERKDDDGYDL